MSTRLLAVLVCATTSLGVAVPHGAGAQGTATSERIEGLRRAVARDGAGAMTAFWDSLETAHAPLVESRPDGRLNLTLVWRGDGSLRNVAVFSAVTSWSAPGNVLRHLPGTDLWYGTWPVDPDARFTYRFSPNDDLEPYLTDPHWPQRVAGFHTDPFNPDTISLAGPLKASLFEGPKALRSTLLEPVPDASRGRITSWDVPGGDAFGATLRAYVPAGAPTPPAGGFPLMVVLDGSSYISGVEAPVILDNLIARKEVPPLVAVFVNTANRTRDLSANEAFTNWLADAVVPRARATFHAGSTADGTTIAGSSLGGLAAAYAALMRPDAFAGVISQSGAFWWSPPGDRDQGWLIRAYATSAPRPTRFYLEAGRLETGPIRGGASMLELTRRMHEVLCGRGYSVAYRETGGDHAYVSWRYSFGDAVRAIYGSSPTTRSCEDREPG